MSDVLVKEKEAALLIAMRAGRTTQWRKVLEELKAERDAQ